MALIVKTHAKCDLCGAENITDGASTVPTNWLKLTFENHMEERSFYDRVVCPSCIQTITKKRPSTLSVAAPAAQATPGTLQTP